MDKLEHLRSHLFISCFFLAMCHNRLYLAKSEMCSHPSSSQSCVLSVLMLHMLQTFKCMLPFSYIHQSPNGMSAVDLILSEPQALVSASAAWALFFPLNHTKTELSS